MKTNYPDSLTIQQYLEGKLDPEMAHELEKQALEDPFLWDALEGYSVYKDPAADLSILQRQLHERIVHLQENKKVFDLSWQRLSVAAAAAVMFVSAGILFWMNSNTQPDQLASQSQKPVEVNIIDRDSVEAVLKSKDAPVIASLEQKEAVLDRPALSANRPANPINRKAVISPKAESEIAAKHEIAPVEETQARTVILKRSEGSDAVPAPAAARQAKTATIAENNVAAGYNAQPKFGWQAYREYLTLNTRAFKNEAILRGSVLLSFEIGPTGELSNIKVVRGLNEAYNKEAIRIVKEGPAWLPSPDGKRVETRVEVDF